MTTPKLLDTIALLNDIPTDRLTLLEPAYTAIQQLPGGLMDAIVQIYGRGDRFYQVEFSDAQGCKHAIVVLKTEEIKETHVS